MDLRAILDLIKAGVPAQAKEFLEKLNSLTPKHFVGNFPPNTHHFDSVDHFAWGGDIPNKRLWFEFKYTDAGQNHSLRAEIPFANVMEVGKRGKHDVLIVDGTVMGIGDPQDFIIGQRFGWFGFHAVFEFYWLDKHVRFDQA